MGPGDRGGRTTRGLLRIVTSGFCGLEKGSGDSGLLFGSIAVCPGSIRIRSSVFGRCLRVTRRAALFFDLAGVAESSVANCRGKSVALSRTLTRHAEMISCTLGRWAGPRLIVE